MTNKEEDKDEDEGGRPQLKKKPKKMNAHSEAEVASRAGQVVKEMVKEEEAGEKKFGRSPQERERERENKRKVGREAQREKGTKGQ
jgi:hypothetical protein